MATGDRWYPSNRGVMVIPWLLATGYVEGNVVLNPLDGLVYEANGTIAGGTAFNTGWGGATWRIEGSEEPLQFLSVELINSFTFSETANTLLGGVWDRAGNKPRTEKRNNNTTDIIQNGTNFNFQLRGGRFGRDFKVDLLATVGRGIGSWPYIRFYNIGSATSMGSQPAHRGAEFSGSGTRSVLTMATSISIPAGQNHSLGIIYKKWTTNYAFSFKGDDGEWGGCALDIQEVR